MPTLLEAAGVGVFRYLEGHFLVPRLRHSDALWRECLHGEHVVFGQPVQWMVTQQHKYVWWSETGVEGRLVTGRKVEPALERSKVPRR